MQVQVLVSLSGLEIQHCCKPRYRLQTQPGSCVAVAVARSYSSDLTPSLGISIRKKKKKEKSNMMHKRQTGSSKGIGFL